jgi:two-component system, NarL family, nitrate/nitrite response regulator NarL
MNALAVTARAARPIRVLIADQHGPTRLGERMALEATGFDVVDESASAEAVVAAARRHRPHVCLLDAGLAGGGLSAAAAIAALAPASSVVIVADAGTPEDVLDALDVGAAGYLLKNVTAERLAQHVADAADGHLAISPSLVRPLVQRLPKPQRSSLTVREREVMRLLRMNLSTKQVAQRLRLSPGTVRRHASSAVRKLGAAGRSDAIADGDRG